MPKKSLCTSSKKQLLGEIETPIAGMQYYNACAAPGEQVNLEREHDNTHDENSIRVENGLFEPVGHIPRQLCSWLAPLHARKGCVGNQKYKVMPSPTPRHGTIVLWAVLFVGNLHQRQYPTSSDTSWLERVS